MTQPPLATRLTARLIAARWGLLALGAMLLAVAIPASSNLHFDRSIENMFAPHDPLLEPYRQLKRTFGGNEVIMAVYAAPDLMTRSGIARLAKLSQKLEQVPGVEAVLALDRLMGPKIIDEQSPLAARFRQLFSGYTHRQSPDGTGYTAAVVCMLTPEAETDVPRAETVARLRQLVAPLPQGMVAGEPVMIVDGFRYLERDGVRLGWTTTFLLMLTIVLCFRSFRWVLIPLAVVQLTLHLTRAVLVWSGFRLSMVSSMLTAIVTVVGVATVIHIIVRFREARDGGLPRREALLAAGGLLAVPIFWACCTDAVGFASLQVARVGPVQDFGIMMAAGSLLAIAAVALLVPGLALAGRWDADPRRAWGEGRLDRGLQSTLHLVERRPRTLALLIAAVSLAAASGSYRLQVETDFTANFREGSPVVESYRFVESHLGGAGVWDVVLPAPEHLDWEYLKRVARLETRLRAEVPGLTKVLSLADAVQAAAPTDPDDLPLALLRNAAVSTALGFMQDKMPVFYSALYSEDPAQPGQHYLRIMLRAPERQSSAEKQAMIAAVRRISREAFPQAEVTGYFVLLTNLIDSIVQDQWRTFGVAMLGIGLMMLAALRSLRLALIALVPNVLPILIITGIMGWLGLKINMGAAMIAAVSLGLSIDSSIHYLSGFRRARGAGLTTDAALQQVQRDVGRALFFATLALVIGFGALVQSEFVPTVYFGVLVSLTMLGGLLGNLLVLPLLLRITER